MALYFRAIGGSTKSSYPSRSRLERRRAAESVWIAVLPLLVGPYLTWKHTCVPSRPEIESDIVWSVPVFGLKGSYGH